KEITLFVDGDRGGKLIARNVVDNARIDFIAVAPDGKEVEELQGKEILTALRRKIPSKDFFRSRDERQEFRRNSYEYDDRRSYPERREWKREPFIPKQESVPKEEPKSVEFGENEKEKLKKFMEEIEGTKSAYLLDDKLDVVKKVSSRGIGASLMRNKASVIVIDGMVTGSVIQAAEGAGVNAIAAKNFASTDTKIKLISL
ncbi:MAG: hypothetical protein KKB21_01795, partial [Nanoarchaeota archaeon]|nr:hypothetical protein [Nanoarchaeota archaeon]